VIFVVLIEWRRDLLIVYVLIFVIFCDFPGSGLFEREQKQRDGDRESVFLVQACSRESRDSRMELPEEEEGMGEERGERTQSFII
jgi:hypothetical protein